MRTHYLKTRLTPSEFKALAARADAAGVTVSEHVRTVLARDREAVQVDHVLARIESRLTEPSIPVLSAGVERALNEMLLLVRELAADRNAQILLRVAQKLQAQISERAPK